MSKKKSIWFTSVIDAIINVGENCKLHKIAIKNRSACCICSLGLYIRKYIPYACIYVCICMHFLFIEPFNFTTIYKWEFGWRAEQRNATYKWVAVDSKF